MVKWWKMSHNYKNIQCNICGFIDSTFRPKGGPSSGNLITISSFFFPGSEITCASCRQPTVVPRRGIAGLQTDFNASKLLDGVGDTEPLIPSKPTKAKSHKRNVAIGVIILCILIGILIAIIFVGLPVRTDAQDGSIVKGVPANRGMVLASNNSVLCIGDSQHGKINITLVSVAHDSLSVQKRVTVGLEPANLKSVKNNEMVLVDKESGVITKWSLPDLKQTASYPSVFIHQNNTIIGDIVNGDSLYVLFFKGTIARYRIKDMALLDQYNLDPRYFNMGDYFMYLGPLHVYRGGLEDNPFINVFNVMNGSYITSITTDCYRRPYARDGYVGSKGKTTWELRNALTLQVVLRADFSKYLPPGRTLVEQKVRFGVYNAKRVAVFTSFFGLVFDLETQTVLKEVESPELKKGNIPPHPIVWMNDKVFVVGFKDNIVHRFVL